MTKADIASQGRRRKKEGKSLIDNHEENPFDTTADALSDIYIFFMLRQSYLTPEDYRNKTRILGMTNLLRAAFKVLPGLKKDLEEGGIVIRRENNDL